MEPKYGFMLWISDDDILIKDQLKEPPTKFSSAENVNQMLNMVPKGMTIDGKNGRYVLSKDIIDVINHQTEEIANLNREICSEMEIKLSERMDELFNRSYDQWILNAPNGNEGKRVKHSMYLIEFDHQILSDQFTKKIKTVNTLKVNITLSIAAFECALDKLLPSNDSRIAKKCFEDIVAATVKISSLQFKLLSALDEFKNVVVKYNNARVKWAEFIIGMRRTLKSERKLVKPDVNPKKLSKIHNIVMASANFAASPSKGHQRSKI